MTITKDQAQMLTTLAIACRPNGARRWDTAGVMAALERIRHWSLAETIAETITAATDKDADTPGVIGKMGRRWQASVGTYTPEDPGAPRCTVCGKVEAFYEHKRGYGHPFSTPRPPRDIAEVRARIAALKAELAPTAGPTQRRTLDDMAAANPALHERLEAVRAAIPALREIAEQETVHDSDDGGSGA